MKILKEQLDRVLVDLNNEPVKKDDNNNATLRNVAIMGLTSLDPNDKITGEDKYKYYVLSNKLNVKNSDAELTAEEITLIKNNIGKFFTPLIVGQCWDILENKLV